MKQKILDTTFFVSDGGRAKQWWAGKEVESRFGAQSKEISLHALAKKYRLKGFEFGNWLNNNERYDHVLATARALEKFEKLVGTDNLGFEMLLGVAYGARGLGGAAVAHYEPGHNMINITATRGAGSFAHEWAHAFDYNVGRYIDRSEWYQALTGGHSIAASLEKDAGRKVGNPGCQFRYYANKIVDQLKQTKSFQALAGSGCDDYWLRRTEVFARGFEQYVCMRLGTKKDLYLHKESYAPPVYWTAEEIRQVMPDFDALLREYAGYASNKVKLRAMHYWQQPATKQGTTAKKTAPKKKATGKAGQKKATPTPAPKKVTPKQSQKKNELTLF